MTLWMPRLALYCSRRRARFSHLGDIAFSSRSSNGYAERNFLSFTNRINYICHTMIEDIAAIRPALIIMPLFFPPRRFRGFVAAEMAAIRRSLSRRCPSS